MTTCKIVVSFNILSRRGGNGQHRNIPSYIQNYTMLFIRKDAPHVHHCEELISRRQPAVFFRFSHPKYSPVINSPFVNSYPYILIEGSVIRFHLSMFD